MEAFVYRWRNTKTKMWYIGFHKGTAADGYICSSKILRPLILSNPQDFERKILRWGTKQEMSRLERKLLKKLRARQSPQSYNQTNGNGVQGGRPKGSGHKIPITDILDKVKEYTGKTIWENIMEHYVDCIQKREYKLVRKYEKGIFLKHLGFDPDYFKNAK